MFTRITSRCSACCFLLLNILYIFISYSIMYVHWFCFSVLFISIVLCSRASARLSHFYVFLFYSLFDLFISFSFSICVVVLFVSFLYFIRFLIIFHFAVDQLVGFVVVIVIELLPIYVVWVLLGSKTEWAREKRNREITKRGLYKQFCSDFVVVTIIFVVVLYHTPSLIVIRYDFCFPRSQLNSSADCAYYFFVSLLFSSLFSSFLFVLVLLFLLIFVLCCFLYILYTKRISLHVSRFFFIFNT